MELSATVVSLEKKRMPGIFIEAGCALGGSSIVIASVKSPERPFFLYDVFGMIPPPSQRDGADVQARYEIIRTGRSKGINGELYYGYQEDLYETVQDNFKDFGLDLVQNNVHLVRGLYEHTLHVNTPVAFAHIDCDWYESVIVCLQRIAPFLVKEGILVIDDYHAWSGCRAAIDEFFSDKKGQYLFQERRRLQIKKIA